jgi:hypothetical protein
MYATRIDPTEISLGPASVIFAGKSRISSEKLLSFHEFPLEYFPFAPIPLPFP